ncbi:GNAT family N-acetyltransferase [Breoghania sp.]|uniref:GNAT family N-acetyltransferase n=1 Tax=Breoghania sp. TaxID=2065378 RepID=UPI00260C2547|nr:GNAT family N-acetyltransferase [Breoghania sp.]MDJ0931749.1 GNAT family N-acetyltransferase [Breoghania sp.]
MPSPALSIRPYARSDMTVLSSIWFEASREAHAFLGEEFLRSQRAAIEETYLPGADVWVACLNGVPVGFIGLLGSFIGGLFVDPKAQGQGIGRALLAHAQALKGELSLEVYAENTRACAFYRRLGFRETERRARDDNDLPHENIRMRLVPAAF